MHSPVNTNYAESQANCALSVTLVAPANAKSKRLSYPKAAPSLSRLVNDSGNFLSAVSHEIRNPLTNINLSVQVLIGELDDGHLKPYLDIIIRSSARINILINELLHYQEADNTITEMLSLHQLLDEVVEMAEDRIELKNIAVIKEYDIQDCKMLLNKATMKIALTNIIINAIDAMDPVKGQLKLITKSVTKKYVIQIEDNGCGISKTNLDNIFKAYYTNKPGGLGLGLAKTYDILHANHINIHVESTEGKGTRFTLFFDENHNDHFKKKHI